MCTTPTGATANSAFDLAADKVRVIDTSESSIESREAALLALREVGQPNAPLEGVLIYVPTKRSETDEQKQADSIRPVRRMRCSVPTRRWRRIPESLPARQFRITRPRFVKCLPGLPPGPTFAVIDAIGGGVSWPQLRASLRVESGREILAALLAPSASQTDALKVQEGWAQETRDFLRATLGLSVKTRGKTWGALADELWRYVLFSEFVFDLPVALPETLEGVPHAPMEAKPIVEDVCDRLRSDPKSRAVYIERAEAIEAELNLTDLCGAIEDLGERDTFPFEERDFPAHGDQWHCNRGYRRHTPCADPPKEFSLAGQGRKPGAVGVGAVRPEPGPSPAKTLNASCQTHARSQSELIDFYLGSLREADRLQREFEQAAGDFLDQYGLMHEVISQARARYRPPGRKGPGRVR